MTPGGEHQRIGCRGIGCRGLVVRAGGRVILAVERLDVAAGQTLAVLGANGAGKSTLLRALAMLVRFEGAVLLDGHAATRAALRSATAAVLQRPILRRGTVAMNAASALRMRGVGRPEAHRRCSPWLRSLGVAHLAGRDVRTLSGGEAQRVSIARALAVDPRVLLLDEPFTGLDATTRSDLLADLRAALSELGAATVLVTHDRDEAAALADRTLVLVDGTTRQCGPTAEVLDSPADTACARLVGFTNALPRGLTGLDHTVVARPEHTAPLVPGRDPGDDVVTVAGRVRRIVRLGGITRIDVAAGDVLLACLGADEAVTAGAEVCVAVPRSRVRPVPD